MSDASDPSSGLPPEAFEVHLPKMTEDVAPERMDVVTKRLRAASHGDLSPRRTALKDLADTTRLLIDRLVATDAPDDVIAAATAEVASAADRFERAPPGVPLRLLRDGQRRQARRPAVRPQPADRHRQPAGPAHVDPARTTA